MSVVNKVICGIFLCFIFGIGVSNLVSKNMNFSEIENRVLSQMPQFTFDSFISGEFTDDFEVYLSDQFVWKKFWVGLNTDVERVTLKKENNGVFFGKEDYLLEGYDKPGEQLQKNINNILYFLNKAENITSYLMVAPTSVGIYNENLPLYAPSFSQKETLTYLEDQFNESIIYLDVYGVLLREKEEQIYFRTDHHWTSIGAYYAYEAAAKKMGFRPYRKDDFSVETVSNDFYGTLYSKASAYRIEPDEIEIFLPKFNLTYEVEYEVNDQSSNTLYEWDNLNKKDQYAVFLNGNHSLVKIKSSLHNGRKLVVIKDSYAHAFIPFLANHFEEIHVIDLRYYHLNIYEYLDTNEIDEVLFLYNLANFSQDKNMIWLKQ
ncbi:DHHW family protein [Paenisporosarcina indica]|uniref:DHHW family protein n=1 Tax=Paenisporosarcina indica TaxID=650093 RepID=UPI0009500BA7|nr:DHHW family protein [Paenisporosarcina indica]